MQQLMEKLNNLPTEYQSIPFWSWNDELEEDVLREQIRWMKDNGIGGFFMHARGGLKTPYLSEKWMDLTRACCREAEAQGMHAWAYDENGWPSGFVGGKLLEDLANRDMYITYTQGSFDPKADVAYGITESHLVRTDGQAPFAQYLNLYFHIAASTADILNPDVVRKFLDLTHEQYKHHIGPEFARKIDGFFTDEPQYYRADTPYTVMLPKYFRQVYGEDILDNLGLLFVEKEGYQVFRYRYWLAMQKLMLESFGKQVYDWCEENGVKLTGHYIEERSLGGQMICCAGVMPFYEYEHIPGIDWLGMETYDELGPRQLGSAARQLGKKQTITESFACCGWNVTPAELRRIAGFQYACGVNLLCQHLLPYSEHGQRKRDHPEHFCPINPWVPAHFREFNDYFTRLGYMLAESQEPVNVAMLHPIRSAYLNYKRNSAPSDDLPGSDLDSALASACRSLSSQGIAYHLLDETLLENHGFVDGDRIGCGQCSYTYLVVPKILTMGAHTEKLLRRFAENGGKLLMLDEAPALLEGAPFCFEYLRSSCTMEDILQAQPFAVENPDNELYYTYRTLDGKPFLFIQNASGSRSYTQTFSFRDGTASFLELDPVSGDTKPRPLTVRLGKNEAAILFLSREPAPGVKLPEIFRLEKGPAKAEFDRNFLTLDAVQYSRDGVSFSQSILCNDLCQLLLQERYEGKIWLRYPFDVQVLPESLSLLSEKSDAAFFVNGKPIVFSHALKEEPCVAVADIAACVHVGTNYYETALNWHQSEATYYALFGEGVTESLRNCIAYDSEIEAVYLTGKFGVYTHRPFEAVNDKHVIGRSFYIGAVPETVTEPVTQGLPFFRGELTLTRRVELEKTGLHLALDGDFLTAKVWVNGQYAGELCFQDILDISPYAREGANEIRVTYVIGNRNLLGPFHASSENGISPYSFEVNDLPEAEDGAPGFKLRLFYGAN